LGLAIGGVVGGCAESRGGENEEEEEDVADHGRGGVEKGRRERSE
jgi:hypothetical protein